MKNALQCLIPVPRKTQLAPDGELPLNQLRGVYAPADLVRYAQETVKLAHFLELKKVQAVSVPTAADISFKVTPDLPPEGFHLQITPEKIAISGGAESGVFYAFQALRQICFAAAAEGSDVGKIPCGEIWDEPRFAWRGFMLDSARHFQPVAMLKSTLRMLSSYRINVLHWHLTDNQSWRLAEDVVDPEVSLEVMDQGTYSRAELAEVVAYARENFIQIVPELDVPGHSRGLVAHYPELSCDPANPGDELCLGSPATMPFVKKLFEAVMEIFPDSPYIHLGGDEADTQHWEKCPRCQMAMKKAHCQNLRELENKFMRELSAFIVAHHRTPIMWGTNMPLNPETVMQNWLDIREPLKHAANGNKVIMSVHTSYYFDYPAAPSEPHCAWMFGLPPESVYMADPYVIWEKELKSALLGPEACLWTETVPYWRIPEKILPRLGAYSEVAWSLPEHKNWADFQERQALLRMSGYERWCCC